MNKKLSVTILAFAILVGGYFYLSQKQAFDFSGHSSEEKISGGIVNEVLAARFGYLNKNGNSSCSGGFKDSIANMPDDTRLQGSCCSPMSIHRYSEQVEGLVKFKSAAGQNIDKIPDDPYDIEAVLAKELMSYYDMELTPDEQKAYDYAMQNSSEKGPCCCKCWRWHVYGGLGKLLIQKYHFTGEQVTEVWDLSDGCGGDSEHHQ
ncbi:MAG: hypothetical protein HYS15_02315 [Candidatus Spechtbacteria bacterium]|nr:hypothetical protein [Candidatus Spechtbacteria bacterium]